jgi:hypothetical protein
MWLAGIHSTSQVSHRFSKEICSSLARLTYPLHSICTVRYPDSTNSIRRSSHFLFRMTKKLSGSTATTLSIDGGQIAVHRYPIKKFDITNDEGKDKWTTYIFTTNVYDIYGPMHVERLRSAVDQLPDPLSDQHQSQQSDLDVLSQPDEEESQTSQPSFKKPRSKRS